MSWKKVKMGDFLKVRDTRFKPNDSSIADLKRIDKIDFSGEMFISDKPSNTDMILIKKGDLVISGINVEKGAMAVYTGEEDITATIHYSSYSFDEKETDIEFLKFFLKSIEFKTALKEQVPGGIKTEIKPKHLLPLVVEIPTDINNQKEVVEILKSRNSTLDAISTELTHQLTLVKKLRQQLLQDAVQGKLVGQNKNDEPASELLKKIKAEKEKLIAEKKLKKEKELPPIKPEEIPFDIPKNWEWCRLGDLIDIERQLTYGIVKMGEEPNTDGVFALRCSDVRYRFIDLKNVRKVTQSISNQYSRTVLKGGEILLNVRGTLGGCAITEDTVKGFNIAREISLIVLQDTLLNDFVFNVLTSPFFNIEIGKKLRGIAYKGLNLNLLNSFLIPMPPLAEQTRIVQKLDELMQYCNELEASIKQSESQNEKLLQQVLREALRPKAIEEQQDSLSFAAEPQGNYKKQKAIR